MCGGGTRARSTGVRRRLWGPRSPEPAQHHRCGLGPPVPGLGPGDGRVSDPAGGIGGPTASRSAPYRLVSRLPAELMGLYGGGSVREKAEGQMGGEPGFAVKGTPVSTFKGNRQNCPFF